MLKVHKVKKAEYWQKSVQSPLHIPGSAQGCTGLYSSTAKKNATSYKMRYVIRGIYYHIAFHVQCSSLAVLLEYSTLFIVYYFEVHEKRKLHKPANDREDNTPSTVL